MLVWNRNESLLNDRPEQEETPTDSLRSQRRSQQRSGRGRAGKLMKKKLTSLEETGTKIKTTTGSTKEKQTQRRKRT